MAKKIDYTTMFTLRKDGRWQKYVSGKCLTDKDPARLLERVRAAENPAPPSAPTFREVAEAWHDAHSVNVSFSTLQGYAAPLKRLNAAFGDRIITDITPAEIKAFIHGLAKRGFTRTPVQRPLDIMRMIYDFAITSPGSMVTSNPCASVKLPTGLKQERRCLPNPEDIQRIRDSVNLPFGLFAYLLLFSGLRKGEALALTYEDFDLQAGKIAVYKSVSWQTNQPVIKAPKTEAGKREAILLDAVRDALPKRWSGYLFSSDGGKTPLSSIEFRHRWEAYCRAAGLADATVTERKTTVKTGLKNQGGRGIVKTYKKTTWKYRIVPHQLRHEFATMCFDADILPRDAQEMMGHAKVETTEAIYTHIRESRREKTGSKLNDYVKSMAN